MSGEAALPLTDLVLYTFLWCICPIHPPPNILCLIVSLAVIHSL